MKSFVVILLALGVAYVKGVPPASPAPKASTYPPAYGSAPAYGSRSPTPAAKPAPAASKPPTYSPPPKSSPAPKPSPVPKVPAPVPKSSPPPRVLSPPPSNPPPPPPEDLPPPPSPEVLPPPPDVIPAAAANCPAEGCSETECPTLADEELNFQDLSQMVAANFNQVGDCLQAGIDLASGCGEDIAIKQGCCSQNCKPAMDSIASSPCAQVLFNIFCDNVSPAGLNYTNVMDRLIHRCVAQQMSCNPPGRRH